MEALISPQPCAVGEASKINSEMQSGNRSKISYASMVNGQQAVENNSQLELCPISFDQDVPTVEFIVDEVNSFTKEEGLQQAVILKFSYGKPNLQDLRQILPNQFGVKGSCNIGQLEYRHILVRFDLLEDFAQVVSRTNGYIRSKGSDFFFRSFPWTMEFNPREETPKAVVWISLPDLPANLFAKKSLLSIASAVGKPIAVDKATNDRTRPSTARVKVLINLLDNHPTKIKIKIVDPKTGKAVDFYQKIVIDNAPAFCMFCKHQGHNAKSCRRIAEKGTVANANASIASSSMPKLKGDARDYLNAKQAVRQSVVHVADQLKTSTTNVQGVQGISPPNAQRWQVKEKQNTAANSISDADQLVNKEGQVVKCNKEMFEDQTDKSIDISVADSAEKLATVNVKMSCVTALNSLVIISAQDDQLVNKEGQVVKCNRDLLEGKTVDCAGEQNFPSHDKEKAQCNKDKSVKIVTADPDVSGVSNVPQEPAVTYHREEPTADILATSAKTGQKYSKSEAVIQNVSSSVFPSTVETVLNNAVLKENFGRAALHTDLINVVSNQNVIAPTVSAITSGLAKDTIKKSAELKPTHINVNGRDDADQHEVNGNHDLAEISNAPQEVVLFFSRGEPTAECAKAGQILATEGEALNSACVFSSEHAKIEDLHKGQEQGYNDCHIESEESAQFNVTLAADMISKPKEVFANSSKIQTTIPLQLPSTAKTVHYNTVLKENFDRSSASKQNVDPKNSQPVVDKGNKENFDRASKHNADQQISQHVVDKGNKDKHKLMKITNDSEMSQAAAHNHTEAYEKVDDDVHQNTTLPDKGQQITTEEEEANTACSSSKMDSQRSNKNDSALANFSKVDEKEAGGVIQKVQSYTPMSISNIYDEGSINDNGEFLSLNGKNKQEIRYNMRDLVIKSKLWDQCYSDEDESLDEGFTGWSSDREGQQDGCNNTGGNSEATINPKVQRISANKNENVKQSVGESSIAGIKTASPNFGQNQKLFLHNRQPQMNCAPTENKLVASSQDAQYNQIPLTLLTSSDKIQKDMEGEHIYEEGEEEDILTQCRKNATRMGDLSPTHSKTSKMSHQRDRSWDGRITEDANKRKLPMRIAKQKQITQNSFRKPNKSKNKA